MMRFLAIAQAALTVVALALACVVLFQLATG